MKKNTVSIALCFLLILSAVFFNNVTVRAGIVDRGFCGQNVKWTLDSDGKLTISGSGKMNDYVGLEDPPYVDFSFVYDMRIKNVVVEKGVTHIGAFAFANCSGINKITLPEGLVSIGNGAFDHCGVKSINLPETLTSVGNYAFSESGLESVYVPKALANLGEGPFLMCYRLKSIKVDAGNKNYSSDERGVLFNKNKSILIRYPAGNTSGSYSVPAGVTAIGNGAFDNCERLKNVSLPEGLKKIEDRAFSQTILKSIRIPKGLQSIGYSAFWLTFNKDSGSSVYFTGSEKEWKQLSNQFLKEDLLNDSIKYARVEFVIMGDVNGDGKRNADDGFYFNKYLLFPELFTLNPKLMINNLDLNGDGKKNANDGFYLNKNNLFPEVYPVSF